MLSIVSDTDSTLILSIVSDTDSTLILRIIVSDTDSTLILSTNLNPQNLRNIIKKFAKISIIQISMSNLSVKTTVFCYFLQLFRYPPNFARLSQ